jgi:hypothetical protein
MSPPRLGPPSNTFNYFEDTLEIARLRINPAHCSSRKRPRRAGTVPINGSRPQDYPRHRASSRVHCIEWFGALGRKCEQPLG